MATTSLFCVEGDLQYIPVSLQPQVCVCVCICVCLCRICLVGSNVYT